MFAHIHENPLTGLKRNLFWSVSIDFAPIRYAGVDFRCAMLCDWIPWRARDWRQLDGQKLEVEYAANGTVKSGPPGVEASFYTKEHDSARGVVLRLHHKKATQFTAAMKMVVNFRGYVGGDENPRLVLAGETQVRYRGLIVVKDNLRPRPTTESKVLTLAEQFVDLTTYREPIDDGWRWRFLPKAFRRKMRTA